MLDDTLWIPVRDGDPRALALYRRHYSCYHYRDGRRPRRFVGPGERLVLLTQDCLALFVWRKFRSQDHQEGVNCAVFRNEGPHLSSSLILDAMQWAWLRWPGLRLYTYVNPCAIRSSNPGFCFLKAGWRRYGATARRQLLVLECVPASPSDPNFTGPRLKTPLDVS